MPIMAKNFKTIAYTSAALHNDCAQVARLVSIADESGAQLELSGETLLLRADADDLGTLAVVQFLLSQTSADDFPADDLDLAFCGCEKCASARLAHAESIYAVAHEKWQRQTVEFEQLVRDHRCYAEAAYMAADRMEKTLEGVQRAGALRAKADHDIDLSRLYTSHARLASRREELEVRDALAEFADFDPVAHAAWHNRVSAKLYGKRAASAWRESAQELFDMLRWE